MDPKVKEQKRQTRLIVMFIAGIFLCHALYIGYAAFQDQLLRIYDAALILAASNQDSLLLASAIVGGVALLQKLVLNLLRWLGRDLAIETAEDHEALHFTTEGK
jgi:hypothetical protein